MKKTGIEHLQRTVLQVIAILLILIAIPAVAEEHYWTPGGGTDINVNPHTHTWSDWVVDEPGTCTRESHLTRKCSGCGIEQSKYEITASHKWGQWTVTKKATCSEEGSRKHRCSVCGKTKTERIPTKEHT